MTKYHSLLKKCPLNKWYTDLPPLTPWPCHDVSSVVTSGYFLWPLGQNVHIFYKSLNPFPFQHYNDIIMTCEKFCLFIWKVGTSGRHSSCSDQKNLFCDSWQELRKTYRYTPFQTASAILGSSGGHFGILRFLYKD